jgi:2-polyprenyl-3-methyl-5-hydroxy-6-metoxy-1,4-benzoquinol methylase
LGVINFEFISISACPVCKSIRRRKQGLRGELPISDLSKKPETGEITVGVWQCRDCRHIWVDPCPDDKTLYQLYEQDSANYFTHLQEGALDGFFLLLNQYSKTPGNLRDIGCGEGRLLKDAIGWKCTGVEPVPEFARIASQYGKVYPSMDQLSEKYEAIIALAVLEHISDPVSMLFRAHDLAMPDAILIVEVPNGQRFNSWLLDLMLKISGRPWTMKTAPLHSPFHLSEFSKESLRVAATNAGWKIEKLCTSPGKIDYPIPRFLNVLLNITQRISAPFGWALNITMVARKA